jgi:molybdopterin-guanine dinucleotide biosynthesis protein A
MKRRPRAAVGVVLAGGRGVRMGGSKLGVLLHGRPLIAYPQEALQTALDEVAVIAKPGTDLPQLPGAMVWIEPEQPYHPLAGIVAALELAGGRPVLTCPADMPFVSPSLIVRLAQTRPQGAPAVITASEGRLQPLLGCYQPEAAMLLAADARLARVRTRDAVAAIAPRVIEVEDPIELFNVNSPEDLLVAAGMMDHPKVKS